MTRQNIAFCFLKGTNLSQTFLGSPIVSVTTGLPEAGALNKLFLLSRIRLFLGTRVIWQLGVASNSLAYVTSCRYKRATGTRSTYNWMFKTSSNIFGLWSVKGARASSHQTVWNEDIYMSAEGPAHSRSPWTLPPLRSGENHSWISSGPLNSRMNRGKIGDPLVGLVVHLGFHGA